VKVKLGDSPHLDEEEKRISPDVRTVSSGILNRRSRFLVVFLVVFSKVNN
jgi:hypothetical protein